MANISSLKQHKFRSYDLLTINDLVSIPVNFTDLLDFWAIFPHAWENHREKRKTNALSTSDFRSVDLPGETLGQIQPCRKTTPENNEIKLTSSP